MEKLSVIIPAFNVEKYLQEAVMSVKQQKWPGEMEIILIDDGSADDTLAIAQKSGDIVFTKKRGGAASARNAGIKAASGELILLLDADDLLVEGALERLYEPFLLYKEKGIMAVFGKARDFVSPELAYEEKSRLRVRKDSYGGVLPGCSLIRREVFYKIGLFDENLRTGETVAWQMQLRDAKISVKNIDFVTVKRRLHMNNTGRVSAQQEMEDYAAILRKRLKK